MVRLINYPVPTEGIQHRETSVNLNIENVDIGTGTLFITESFVLWLDSSDQGVQLDYRLICLHAISRDLNAFPHEHLLCHYVGKLPGINDENNDESDGSNEADEESEGELIEIRFIPENKDSLQVLFDSLANCQTLHPDSDCQLSGDEFDDAEDNFREESYDNEGNVDNLTEQGRINLERFNQMLNVGQGDADITAQTNLLNIANGYEEEGHVDEEQFEDADQMDQ
ncbi:methylosome subunit pICln [Biomphalaria pfeifferi]|uniref:Methylosome subunit pICln n=1 Tax=Biomphalaria pfeifferi TaxID=112525 RepID=A0AAD8BVR0_BIOPF|nr:methylosome subunit pICln [Biomphalaria pfeifferi]